MDKLRKNGGYFEKFEWMPEGYGQMKELAREERIHKKILETNLHDQPFNLAMNKKQLKHEYPFQDNT